jgi:hypothetical protein
MPYIKWHLPVFRKLKCPWRWIIVEGPAMNNGSTKWCQSQPLGWSTDGTNEYFTAINDEKHVQHWAREAWDSKDEMANFALSTIDYPCVVMQIDADEIHTPENIDKIVELFTNDPQLGAIRMPCRFFVGPRLVCIGQDCWSSRWFEWDRAWRFAPGIEFLSHEPPRLNYYLGRIMEREEAKTHRLSFDHYAYALRKQVEYKEKFYGYKGLTNQWKALQAQTHFPEPLQRFFPFVDDKVMVDRL